MTSTWYGKSEKIILKLSYMTKILSTQPSCLTHEYSNSLQQSSLPICSSQSQQQPNRNLSPHKTVRQAPISSKNLLPSCPHKAHHPFQPRLTPPSICSTDDFFNKRCNELINFLELRGYSRHFIKKEINRVRSPVLPGKYHPTSRNSESTTTDQQLKRTSL